MSGCSAQASVPSVEHHLNRRARELSRLSRPLVKTWHRATQTFRGRLRRFLTIFCCDSRVGIDSCRGLEEQKKQNSYYLWLPCRKKMQKVSDRFAICLTARTKQRKKSIHVNR